MMEWHYAEFAVVGVDKAGHLLEGEKRNAKRQEYFKAVPLRSEERRKIFREEVCVFIIADEREVQSDAGNHIFL